jgi:hypothetical protein
VMIPPTTRKLAATAIAMTTITTAINALFTTLAPQSMKETEKEAQFKLFWSKKPWKKNRDEKT